MASKLKEASFWTGFYNTGFFQVKVLDLSETISELPKTSVLKRG